MATPGFTESPESYDRLTVDGWLLPGDWECKEIGRSLDLKQPKGSGDDGGTPRILGVKVASGTISTKLNTDEEERAWATFLRGVFNMQNPKNTGEHVIDQPQFARMNVRRIIVTDVHETLPKGGDPIVGSFSFRTVDVRKGAARKPQPASRFASQTGTTATVIGARDPTQGAPFGRLASDAFRIVTIPTETPTQKIKKAGGR